MILGCGFLAGGLFFHLSGRENQKKLVIGLGLTLLLAAAGITAYVNIEGDRDNDSDGLTNREERMYGTDINVPNTVFKYAIKDKKLPLSIAKPLTSLDKGGLTENAKALVDELTMLPPNAQQFLIDLGLHTDGVITDTKLTRARDLDQDGMPNGFESQIGTDVLKPSIYPYLNRARQTIKDLTPRLFTVRSDYDVFQTADTNTIQKILDWIGALPKSIGLWKTHISDARAQVSDYQKIQEGITGDLSQLSEAWNDPNVSQEAKLKAVRDYNQPRISQSAVDYDTAKGTLPWHINNSQEGQLHTFSQDQNGQHFERVLVFGREGIGEAIRLEQILKSGESILDLTALPSQLFLKYRERLTQPINVPGYVQLVDLQSSMKEPLRQLDSQLFASSQDISNLGKFWTDIENEHVIQPKDRPALGQLYEKTRTSKNALRKMMEDSKSGLEIAKLHYILTNARTEDVDLVVTAIMNAIETGKNLDDVCNVATGLIHELSYGREKGFSRMMTAVCSELPAGRKKLSDSQLYYEIMKTSAFPEPETIDYRDARRLLSGILSSNGRNTFSRVRYTLDEQLISPFATVPTIHENGEYLWTNAWKDAANIGLLKVQQTAEDFPYYTFLITQPLFGGYHSIIKATHLSTYR